MVVSSVILWPTVETTAQYNHPRLVLLNHKWGAVSCQISVKFDDFLRACTAIESPRPDRLSWRALSGADAIRSSGRTRAKSVLPVSRSITGWPRRIFSLPRREYENESSAIVMTWRPAVSKSRTMLARE